MPASRPRGAEDLDDVAAVLGGVAVRSDGVGGVVEQNDGIGWRGESGDGLGGGGANPRGNAIWPGGSGGRWAEQGEDGQGEA